MKKSSKARKTKSADLLSADERAALSKPLVSVPPATAPFAGSQEKTAPYRQPCVLVVDDEADLRELFVDLATDCRLLVAADLAEARTLIGSQPIDVLFTDVHLPDGSGTSLLPELRQRRPAAASVVMTGRPTVESSVTAMQHGASDYLTKPFTARQLKDRLTQAVHRNAIAARDEKRLTRLKTAVRSLNKARRTVSQKVDLLCNDLINAYTDVAQQMSEVRVQESFRSTLTSAHDLEQLLCHAMDWLLKQCGYTNIALWLAGDETSYDLGAYMKYTIVGDKKLTEALKDNLLVSTTKEGFIHLSADELLEHLSPAEKKAMTGQTFMAVSCVYLGESLGAIMMFRDGKCPFNEEDASTLKNIAPIFASFLASVVRKSDDESPEPNSLVEEDGESLDEDQPEKKKKRKDKIDPADWWKRGEAPPF